MDLSILLRLKKNKHFKLSEKDNAVLDEYERTQNQLKNKNYAVVKKTKGKKKYV